MYSVCKGWIRRGRSQVAAPLLLGALVSRNSCTYSHHVSSWFKHFLASFAALAADLFQLSEKGDRKSKGSSLCWGVLLGEGVLCKSRKQNRQVAGTRSNTEACFLSQSQWMSMLMFLEQDLQASREHWLIGRHFNSISSALALETWVHRCLL